MLAGEVPSVVYRVWQTPAPPVSVTFSLIVTAPVYPLEPQVPLLQLIVVVGGVVSTGPGPIAASSTVREPFESSARPS